eukprot:TRINITY_DN304_c2_g1_i1.p1 TRINITY_DN304_c2_g1~~TRINITY_DN304_c2_g1_i1.p1  ORF type:complete len:1577 (+),score=517.38 TRINITY_DN304_c2_g1_i1:125-4855(+)
MEGSGSPWGSPHADDRQVTRQMSRMPGSAPPAAPATPKLEKKEALWRTLYLMDWGLNKHQRDQTTEEEKEGPHRGGGCCGAAGGTFTDNELKSAKYVFHNPFSPHFFLWKNLFEQFHRMANCYFLVQCAIMQVPGVSPLGRWTLLATLVVVLMASMVKAVVEDCRRHADDMEKRNRPTQVLRDGQWATVTWADVVTGDVVRCAIGQGEQDEERFEAEEEDGVAFPCDMILVATPDPQGLVYIATMDLDGETNLKPKQVANLDEQPFARAMMRDGESPDAVTAELRSLCLDGARAQTVLQGCSVHCKGPSKSLSEFDAHIRPPPEEQQSPDGLAAEIFCQFASFLPRGAKLRQVSECVGIAVYTGRDTRLGRNMSTPGAKQPTMEHLTNIRLCYIVLLQLVMCAVSTISYSTWNEEYLDSGEAWYLDKDKLPVGQIFLSFLTFFVLYSNVIPISMYVSMEICKLVQGYFIRLDVAMYDQDKDMPCLVKTTDINEELGQVEHVFSDKTGTLTQNIMQFLKFSCDGTTYGQGLTAIGLAAEAAGIEDGSPGHPDTALDPRPEYVRNSTRWPFYDPLIQRRGNETVTEDCPRVPLWGPPKGSRLAREGSVGYGWRQYNELRRFWEALALCHTVLPKKDGAVRCPGPPGTHCGVLEGESPDEKAFVAAAGELGVAVIRGDASQTTLAIDRDLVEEHESQISGDPCVEQRWERLHVIPFDSTRKRMGVIFRAPPARGETEPQLWLFCKGADQAIEPQLSCVLPPQCGIDPFDLPQEVESYCAAGAKTGPQDYRATCERYSFMRLSMYGLWRSCRTDCYTREEYQTEVVSKIADELRKLAQMKCADGSEMRSKWPADLQRLIAAAGADPWPVVAWDVCQRYQTHWMMYEPSSAPRGRGKGKTARDVGRDLAEEALRVMLVTRRRITQQYWEEWSGSLAAANKIADDDQRKSTLGQLTEEMESCLELCGLSAIEDKLQDRVPEVIQALRDAGIRVWMITGDKPNTAENIALACKLFDTELKHNMIRFDAAQRQQHKVLQVTFERGHEPPEVHFGEHSVKAVLSKARDEAAGKIEAQVEYAVLITSAALTCIWGSEGPAPNEFNFCSRFASTWRDDSSRKPSDRDDPRVQLLYEVLNDAKAVVVARATPDQKKQMVRLIKERNPWAVTLAIGDGANDVSMIQAANIGVGIQGEEGGQAAAQADFAIGKFKFLQRLLFVHGRWNYRRMATFSCYFFYKNAVVSLALFFFNFFNAFSGQSLFDRWVLACFNVLWASWPVIIYAMFDRDVVNTDNLYDFPLLYKHTLLNNDYTGLRVLQWYCSAIFHSMVCLFVPLITCFQGDYLHGSAEGRDYGMYHLGVLVYTCVIVVITLKLAMHVNTWTWVVHVMFWGCFLSWPAFLPFYGDTGLAEYAQSLYWMRRSFIDSITWPMFWLLLLVVVVFCLLRDMVWQYASYNVMPIPSPAEAEQRMRNWKRMRLVDDVRRLMSMRESEDKIGAGVSLHKVMQMMDHTIGRTSCFCCQATSYDPPWEIVPGARPRYGYPPTDPRFVELLDRKGYGRYCSKGEWLCCCADTCDLRQEPGPRGCGMT